MSHALAGYAEARTERHRRLVYHMWRDVRVYYRGGLRGCQFTPERDEALRLSPTTAARIAGDFGFINARTELA